jgi:hypothetical protein
VKRLHGPSGASARDQDRRTVRWALRAHRHLKEKGRRSGEPIDATMRWTHREGTQESNCISILEAAATADAPFERMPRIRGQIPSHQAK